MRVDHDRLTVTTTDSDGVARLLLTSLAARDLEVTTGSLESAFIALTTTASEGACSMTTTSTSPDRLTEDADATARQPASTRGEPRARGSGRHTCVWSLRRVLRDLVTMFFVVGLPAFMYVLFGASAGYSQQSAGNGNVALYVMISMAAYGAVTATVGIGGMAAVERMQGWGRQARAHPAG